METFVVREEVEGNREGKMSDRKESMMNITGHSYVNSVSGGGVHTPEDEGEGTKKEGNIMSNVSVKSTEDSSSVQEEIDEDEEEKKRRDKRIAERLCTVCKEKEGIYRCSRCLQRTCSLVCYKAHEKQKQEDQRNLLLSHSSFHQTEKKQGDARALSHEGKGEEERERSGAQKDRRPPQEEDAERMKDISLSKSSSSSVSFSSSTPTSSFSSPCPLIRRRVEAVKSLRDFNDQLFVKDYRLLEEASRAVEAAARQWKIDAEECAQKSKRRRGGGVLHPQHLRALCASRGISFLFCPPNFSRRLSNTTRIVQVRDTPSQASSSSCSPTNTPLPSSSCSSLSTTSPSSSSSSPPSLCKSSTCSEEVSIIIPSIGAEAACCCSSSSSIAADASLNEEQREGVEILSIVASPSGLIRGEKAEEKEREGGGAEVTMRSAEDVQTVKKEKEQLQEELKTEEKEDGGIEVRGETLSGKHFGEKPAEESGGSVTRAAVIPVDRDKEGVLIAGEEEEKREDEKKRGDERDEVVEEIEDEKKGEDDERENVTGIGDEREEKEDGKQIMKEKEKNVKQHKGKKAGGVGTSAHIEWRVVLHFTGIKEKKVFASVDEETDLGSLLRQALLSSSSSSTPNSGKADEHRRGKKRRIRNPSDHVSEAGILGEGGGGEAPGTEKGPLVCHEEQQKKETEKREEKEKMKKRRKEEEEGDVEDDEEGRKECRGERDLCKVDDEIDIELEEFRRKLNRNAESSTAVEMDEREETCEKEKTLEENVNDQSCEEKKTKEESSSLSGATGETSLFSPSSVQREGGQDDSFSIYSNRFNDLSLFLSWIEISRSSCYSCSSPPPASVPPPPPIVPSPTASHSDNNSSSSSCPPGAHDNYINLVDSSSSPSLCPSQAISSSHPPSGDGSATGGAHIPVPSSQFDHLPSPASEQEKEKENKGQEEDPAKGRKRTTPVRKCQLTWTLRHALRGSTVLEFPEFFVALPEELDQFQCIEAPFERVPSFRTFHGSRPSIPWGTNGSTPQGEAYGTGRAFYSHSRNDTSALLPWNSSREHPATTGVGVHHNGEQSSPVHLVNGDPVPPPPSPHVGGGGCGAGQVSSSCMPSFSKPPHSSDPHHFSSSSHSSRGGGGGDFNFRGRGRRGRGRGAGGPYYPSFIPSSLQHTTTPGRDGPSGAAPVLPPSQSSQAKGGGEEGSRDWTPHRGGRRGGGGFFSSSHPHHSQHVNSDVLQGRTPPSVCEGAALGGSTENIQEREGKSPVHHMPPERGREGGVEGWKRGRGRGRGDVYRGKRGGGGRGRGGHGGSSGGGRGMGGYYYHGGQRGGS
ncbi:hit zinc finger protein [Cystoisospora suis]|uniref:Hit zinc finger protein n=1 Tax=Cystoisospora suis TaxID=483139 RepID=A0A2C6L0I7_9APIC|nr:hit zinc finger protein [Cystoisospora suis]